MSDHSIYISHAWGGHSEEIVQEIYKRCHKAGLHILLDKKDLDYRESISSFMQKLGKADAIILVVSNKYLHSEYCMYELLQIYENKNILNRIFPVVLDEVSIAKSTERLELVKYWENETENLETKIRELKNLSYIEGITDDLNLYQKIRNNIANLTRILKDINTLNIKLHKENDYNQLILAIENYIRQNEVQKADEQSGSSSPVATAQLADSSTPSDLETKVSGTGKQTTKRWWSGLFSIWTFLLVSGLLAAGVYLWFGSSRDEKTSTSQVFKGNEDERPGNINLDKVELSAVNPGSQVSAKEEMDSRPPAAMPEKKTPVKKQTKTFVENPTGNEVTVNGEEKATNKGESLSDTALLSIGAGRQRELHPNTKLVSLEDDVKQTLDGEPDVKPSFRMEEVFVPSSSVSVYIPQNISSNNVKQGDVTYLRLDQPFSFDGVRISEANARVKARVIDAKASHQGSRGALGIRLESLETVDGQWLNIVYHDIVERKRGEIVFQKGTQLNDVEIKPTTINLKIFQ